MSPIEHHPDVFSAGGAMTYLRLDETAPTAAAARELLNRLVRKGRICPFEWGSTRLYHRDELDRFVREELDSLRNINTTAPGQNAE